MITFAQFLSESISNLKLESIAKYVWNLVLEIEKFEKELSYKRKELRTQEPVNFFKILNKDGNYLYVQDQIEELNHLQSRLGSLKIMFADIESALNELINGPEKLLKFKDDRYGKLELTSIEYLQKLLEKYTKVMNYQRPQHPIENLSNKEYANKVKELEKECDNIVKSLQEMF